MIHVVLGMHKSGTTLVSQMLHASGVDMVDDVDAGRGYDDGNKWERESTKAINHALLGSSGLYSLVGVRRGGESVCADARSRMSAVIRDVGSRHADWGFKDPRTCLTYDLWARELPEHRIIVVYRTAEEAWAHYWRTAGGRRRLTVFREFLPRWCEYNAAILSVLARTSMPAIVIHYGSFMRDAEELRRLGRFLERPLVDVREPRMSRSVPGRFDAYRTALACHRFLGGRDPATLVADLHRLAGRPVLPRAEVTRLPKSA